MKILIDANVILRYVLNDIQEMADKASLVINEGSFTTVEILAEVSYVLRNVYKMPKPEAAKTIKAVLLEIEIEQKDSVLYALDLFENYSLDFVDCLIIAKHNVLGVPVFSFDEKLNKRLI